MARSRPLLALLAAVAVLAGAADALAWPNLSWESARLSRLPALKAWATKKDCKTVFNVRSHTAALHIERRRAPISAAMPFAHP